MSRRCSRMVDVVSDLDDILKDNDYATVGGVIGDTGGSVGLHSHSSLSSISEI